jgi:hypothetical protein
MRTIKVRFDQHTNEWNVWSLVLQGWTVAENVYRDFTRTDVQNYYGQYGLTVQFED